MNKDNLRFGLIIGFIAPVFGMLAYYFIQFRNLLTLSEFFHVILVERRLLTAIVSVSLVANAVAFTYYVNKRKDRTGKGIFVATCIYGAASLLWKWVL